MTRVPRITAAQIIKILEKKRFKLSRQSGSHQEKRGLIGFVAFVVFFQGKGMIKLIELIELTATTQRTNSTNPMNPTTT